MYFAAAGLCSEFCKVSTKSRSLTYFLSLLLCFITSTFHQKWTWTYLVFHRGGIRRWKGQFYKKKSNFGCIVQRKAKRFWPATVTWKSVRSRKNYFFSTPICKPCRTKLFNTVAQWLSQVWDSPPDYQICLWAKWWPLYHPGDKGLVNTGSGAQWDL